MHGHNAKRTSEDGSPREGRLQNMHTTQDGDSPVAMDTDAQQRRPLTPVG